MRPALYASCIDLISPIGLTPESASAAMRAGIDTFGELPYADNSGEPIMGAMVPGVEPRLRGRERILALLALAMDGLPTRLPQELESGELPLLLCTREGHRARPDMAGLVTEAASQAGLEFRRQDARHFASGAVSVFEALTYAQQLLAGAKAAACLIVAVDSQVDPRSLNLLDQEGRLKKVGHPDGVIPGEAACTMLVSARRLRPTAIRVLGLGFGAETATVLNEDPLLGNGMAAAVRAALEQAMVPMHEIAFRLSDLAGEAYAFEELVLAQVRTLKRTRPSQDVLHPAGYTGDCGAANGVVQLAWAEQAMHKRYAHGPLALAHASAPDGARAAAVLAQGEVAF